MDSICYNTRLRIFPDGTQQYYKSSRTYYREGEEDKAYKREIQEYLRKLEQEDWVAFAERFGVDYDWQGRLLFNGMAIYINDGSSVERKEIDNAKRAVQVVYNIAKSNPWDYFATFTFDPKKVDSFDYDSCVIAIRAFINSARQRGLQYLIVPEQHDSGRYHFHGLICGNLSNKLVHAVNPKTGMPMLDRAGRPIYNIGDFGYGFTTVTEISDSNRVASYIAKYLSKDISVHKGRKRYWATHGVVRPAEQFFTMSDADFERLIPLARYFDVTENEWGRFVLAEIDPVT